MYKTKKYLVFYVYAKIFMRKTIFTISYVNYISIKLGGIQAILRIF